MILLLLLILLTSSTYLIRYSALNEFNFFAKLLHNECLNLLPENPKTAPVLQALVCGHNFESFETAKLYTAAGLIHLFVVSGSHLILIFKFLDFVLKILNIPKRTQFVFVLLFIYVLVCLFNPPIVRSFLALLLFAILKSKIKYWPKDFVLLLVGLFCMSLSPRWVDSLSLQMSWLAALAIEFNQTYLKKHPHLFKQIPFFALYTFSFSALGYPQISVLIVGLFFNPVLEFILLPLAFGVLALPFLDPIFEVLISILNFILSIFEMQTSVVTTDFAKTISLNWILIFGIHLFFHLSRKPKS